MRYLLDTYVVFDLVRNSQGRVYQKIREIGVENICTSIIVVAEVRFGVAKKRSKKLER